MFRMIVQPELPLLAEEGRSGLEWLLYGHVTVPFWIVALLTGAAVTAGVVYMLRRIPD